MPRPGPRGHGPPTHGAFRTVGICTVSVTSAWLASGSVSRGRWARAALSSELSWRWGKPFTLVLHQGSRGLEKESDSPKVTPTARNDVAQPSSRERRLGTDKNTWVQIMAPSLT